MFSEKGCRRFVRALKPKLLGKLFEGEFLVVLLTFIRQKEIDYGHPFCRAGIRALRYMCGENALEMYSRSDLTRKRIVALNLFHWCGSVYQDRTARDEEDDGEPEDKVKFSCVLSGLPFQVGYHEAIFLRVEQQVFNPLKSLVIRLVLQSDEDTDFPHVDIFGRVGIWRISQDIWCGGASILEHLCRQVGEYVIESGIGNPNAESCKISFRRGKDHNTHLDHMLTYESEEEIRQTIKRVGGSRSKDTSEADQLAFLVCVQVCPTCAHSLGVGANHTLQAASWLVYLESRLGLGEAYLFKETTGMMDCRLIAWRWTDWRHRFSDTMTEFLGQGSIRETMNADFAQELDNAMQNMRKVNGWSSLKSVRALAHRVLLTLKFILAWSIVLDVDQLVEPRSREDIRRLYVTYFAQVQIRYFENTNDTEKHLMEWLSEKFLEGTYAHDDCVQPYIDVPQDVAQHARSYFHKFQTPVKVKIAKIKHEVEFAFKNFPGPANVDLFDLYTQRLEGLRQMHHEYIARRDGGERFLKFLSHMDLEIGRSTLKRARPERRPRRDLKSILKMTGDLKQANNWKNIKKNRDMLGMDMSRLLQLARGHAMTNLATAKEAKRNSPPPPGIGTPTQYSMTQCSLTGRDDEKAEEESTLGVEVSAVERLKAMVEKHASDVGHSWREWTLTRDARANGRNREGAKIMAGGFFTLCSAIVKVGTKLATVEAVRQWLSSLDRVDREEMSQSFVMWVTNVCRPNRRHYLVCLDTWLDTRLQAATEFMWEVLRDVGAALLIGEEARAKFTFLVSVQAIGYNYMKSLMHKSRRLDFDIGYSKWRNWLDSHVDDLETQYNHDQGLELLLGLIHRHGKLHVFIQEATNFVSFSVGAVRHEDVPIEWRSDTFRGRLAQATNAEEGATQQEETTKGRQSSSVRVSTKKPGIPAALPRHQRGRQNLVHSGRGLDASWRTKDYPRACDKILSKRGHVHRFSPGGRNSGRYGEISTGKASLQGGVCGHTERIFGGTREMTYARLKVDKAVLLADLQQHLRQEDGVVLLLSHRWVIGNHVVMVGREDIEKQRHRRRVRERVVGEWVSDAGIHSLLNLHHPQMVTAVAVWNRLPDTFNLDDTRNSDELLDCLVDLETTHFAWFTALESIVAVDRTLNPLVLPSDSVTALTMCQYMQEKWKECNWKEEMEVWDASAGLHAMGEVLMFVRPSNCTETAETVMAQGRRTLSPTDYARFNPEKWELLRRQYELYRQFFDFSFRYRTRLFVALQKDGLAQEALTESDDDDCDLINRGRAGEGGATSAMDVDDEAPTPLWGGFRDDTAMKESVIAELGLLRREE